MATTVAGLSRPRGRSTVMTVTERAHGSWRAGLRRVAAFGVRLIGQAVMLARPRPGHHVVIYGKSAALTSEENALVIAAELARAYDGTVTLLSDDPASSRRHLDRVAAVLGTDAGRVAIAQFTPRRALAEMVRAELLFHTASYLAAPRPRGRRLHIALAHGTSPKWPTMAAYRATMYSSAYCATADAWGRAIMTAFSMPASTDLLTGNPRQDMLSRPGDLATLDLDPARPVVLWMPTYRRADTIAIDAVQDGAAWERPAAEHSEPAEHAGAEHHEATGAPAIETLVRHAQGQGVQLAVKPHPRDVESFAALGIRVISDDDIDSAGMTLYQLIGACDGMISDYSSVWVDYLATGRPIGLFCPDLIQYGTTRGLLEPKLTDVAQDLIFTDGSDVDDFFAAVAEGVVFRGRQLRECKRAIGFRESNARAADLLGELCGLWRGRWPRHPLPLAVDQR